MYAELKNKLELMHCDVNTKLENDTGGLQDCKKGAFAILLQWGIYISEKYMGLPESNKVW